MNVEIRWLEDRPDRGTKDFESFLMGVEEGVTPVAVEKVFKAWLEERVRGRNIIVADLEIYVDGEFYLVERDEESKLFQRIGAAAGK